MSVSRLTSSSCRVPSGDRPPSGGAEHGEGDLARVAADQDGHGVAHPPHIARPSASASTRRVRSGSVSTRSAEGGRPATAAALDADADVGQPDRRGVVHAVAGHRQRRPGPAERGDQAHLLLRGEPGEDRGLATRRTRSVSDARASSAPVTTRSASGMPASAAIAAAVSGWSPVATSTRTPAARSCATARPSTPDVSASPTSPRRSGRGGLVQTVRRSPGRPHGAVRDRDHPQSLGGELAHPLAARPARRRSGRARPPARPSPPAGRRAGPRRTRARR